MSTQPPSSPVAYTPTWKDRLEPFGLLFVNLDEQIDSMLRAMSDADLDALSAATSQVTRTNCWCYAYEAAPKVRGRIDLERSRRSVRWLSPLSASTAQERE